MGNSLLGDFIIEYLLNYLLITLLISLALHLSPLKNVCIYCRYLETGTYKGFFEKKMLPQLKEIYRVIESNVLPWKIFTDKDIQLECNEWPSNPQGKEIERN